MIESVRAYVVKEEFRGLYELAYGPGGLWSRLFEQHDGFRGIMLMRDVEDANRYMEIAVWDGVRQRDEAIAVSRAEYDELMTRLGEWIESYADLGSFATVGAATVRPQGKPRRRKPSTSRIGGSEVA